MKKLKFDDKFSGNDIDKIYKNQFEIGKKINEILDFLQPVPQEKFNAFCRGKVEIDKNDYEVIKKCLRYCRHRLRDHHSSGIHFALSAEDVKTFNRIIENL